MASAKASAATEGVVTKAAPRIDRRFLAHATTAPGWLYGLFAGGGLALGVGAYAQYVRPNVLETTAAPWAFWPLAVGALCTGVGLWFSGSGDAAVRVGAPGVAEERNGLRRIPWHGLKSVRYLEEKKKIEVRGSDEAGADARFLISPRSHRAAVARLLHEADLRTPQQVDVPDSLRGDVGAPGEHDGTRIREPLQVVGKRCACSGKPIAFERDARVCPRCERVYHYRSVPAECACGADLSALQDRMLDDDHEVLAKRTASRAAD